MFGITSNRHLLAFLLPWVLLASGQPASAESRSDSYAAGCRALDAGDYGGAVKFLEQASAEQPGNFQIFYDLGLARSATHRYRAAATAFEHAKALRPNDVGARMQLAIAYMADGAPGKALPELEWVRSHAPRTPNVGFYLGRIHVLLGNYATAAGLLRGTVASNDKYRQLADYYLALSVSRLGNVGEAQSALARASRLFPGSNLASFAEQGMRDLGRLAATIPGKFRVETQATVQYDDNVRVAPDVNVFHLRDRRCDSLGTTLYVRPEYAFLEKNGWRLSWSYAGLQTVNFSIPELNVTDHQFAFNLFHRTLSGTRPVNVGLSLAYDQMLLDGDAFLYRLTAAPYVTVQHSPKSVTTVYGQFQKKNFAFDPIFWPDENRDSHFTLAGAAHYFIWDRGRRHVKVGCQFDRDNTDGLDYRYRGVRPLVGFFADCGSGWSLTLDAQHQVRRYPEVNSIFGITRHDNDSLYVARVVALRVQGKPRVHGDWQ